MPLWEFERMSFKDIVGHEKQIALLQGFMAKNRLPHALLFHGMEGIGKRTTALIFAKALNCVEENQDACDVCSSCRKVEHGNHLDVVILEAQGQFIKIQAVRDLQQQMKFKPWEGKKRVCIIDDAERMNDAAANTLLKTLEEPPASNIIVLISSRPYQLPATILSRCQQLRFNPLPEDKAASLLTARLPIDAQTAITLASSSGGSIAGALEMHKGSYLGIRDDLMDMISEAGTGDPLRRLSLANRLGDDREDILERLGILRMCFRDILFYKETKVMKGLISPDKMNVIKPLSEKLPAEDIISNIRTIDGTLRAVEMYADKTLALEVMMLKLFA
jgi:DNA polymerase III subunit delta'